MRKVPGAPEPASLTCKRPVEPEMALSISNQRRILKMLKELVDQKQFRIVCATHSPVLIEDPQTYVINLDRHINRNVVTTDQGIQGATTLQ